MTILNWSGWCQYPNHLDGSWLFWKMGVLLKKIKLSSDQRLCFVSTGICERLFQKKVQLLIFNDRIPAFIFIFTHKFGQPSTSYQASISKVPLEFNFSGAHKKQFGFIGTTANSKDTSWSGARCKWHPTTPWYLLFFFGSEIFQIRRILPWVGA